MKIPKKQKPITNTVTTLTPAGIGVVRISHHQSIKQSINYQSAEAAYSVEIHCVDDEDAIEETIARAEQIIESALLAKFKQQGRVLNQLAKGRS